MYSIKLVGQNLWLGDKSLTYFLCDDSKIALIGENMFELNYTCFSVQYDKRRIFPTTAAIRRSMGSIVKETIVETISMGEGFDDYDVLTRNGPNRATYRNYEVVDLVNNRVYPLDDVLAGEV
jgi:hypothetical protein